MPEVHEYPIAYQVSIWPQAEETENTHTWSCYAVYRGHGMWAVLVGGENSRMCLAADGSQDWESIPSARTDEWLTAHRFTLDDALALAREHAPKMTVNGLTAVEVLARDRARAESRQVTPWTEAPETKGDGDG